MDMDDEGAYVCGSCGEEIVVPLDLSQGKLQNYVEDCPVCCCPNTIRVEWSPGGHANVWSQPE
ncbi:MAG: hypothetical protein ACI841_005341 [Planctomycetota bacterium]|jgi:hypothetical protein